MASHGGGQTGEVAERYRASMVLAGVGDAMGYRNGVWEFTFDGVAILRELKALGGLDKLSIKKCMVSDDQVMHLATAEALVEHGAERPLEELYPILAKHYVKCFDDMGGRAPGPMTSQSVRHLSFHRWDTIPYCRLGGGCGGAMRAMCIGLRFPGEENRDKLIAASIESSRMTHNHPTGLFGALVAALFTAYAIEKIPPIQWGRLLLDQILPRAYRYLEQQGRDWAEYQADLKYFEDHWRAYMLLRKIDNGEAEPTFPEVWGPAERDAYYSSIAWAGWGGASGHDSVIIAYDALLGAGDSWHELVYRGILHGGDNDSTGVICGAWFGALYGLAGVAPVSHYADLEYRDRAEAAAQRLLALATTANSTTSAQRNDE